MIIVLLLSSLYHRLYHPPSAAFAVMMSLSTLNMRSPSPAIFIHSNSTNSTNSTFDLDSYAARISHEAMDDVPLAERPIKVEDEDELDESLSSGEEGPTTHMRTEYPDSFICFATIDDAVEAIKTWAREKGFVASIKDGKTYRKLL